MINYLVGKVLGRLHADIEHYRAMREAKINEGDFQMAAYCQFKAGRAARLHNKIARFFGKETIMAV